jgi:hypothetical protein
MSNISQFFAGRRKQNRRIIHGGVGVTTITWRVPPGVTEVEVHCWGAGGLGAAGPAPAPGGARGGGGGGYVTHVFPVTPSDSLLITAGASPGGTSSVSVPTQSPISPISATGGSAGTQTGGGGGGSGSYSIAPGISTARTFSASGGAGFYGGGSAGSPFGTGGAGSFGGGGIGGASAGNAGGGSLGKSSGNCGGLGKYGYKTTSSAIAPVNALVSENDAGSDDWFYVDEILGAGAEYNPVGPSNGGAGGGGCYSKGPTSQGGSGGILGGGGAGFYNAPSGIFNIIQGGSGGLGGGGGITSGEGGAGLVILYW